MKNLVDLLSTTVILDGATGTELNCRGCDTALPLWSASALLEAPDLLREVHESYVAAGSQIITANTFRTHERNLAAGGIHGQAAQLTKQAVDIAREAAQGKALVAGSQAPLEDCYSPELVPNDATLVREHSKMAGHLLDAGVDMILIETQNTIREAQAAAIAAKDTGLPFLVSFVCDTNGTLLSAESLQHAVETILPLNPAAIMLNCSAAPNMTALIQKLSQHAENLPIGCYANIGLADPIQGWINTDAESPTRYAEYALAWLKAGATIIGGCCGTTPEHIQRLSRLIDAENDN